jgi:drug/metabolite transporter (DMT)-like permease
MSTSRRLPAVPLTPTALASVALVTVTAAWGSTFFLLKDVVTRIPAADFLAVRFLLASVVLTALVPGAVRRLSRAQLRQSVVLGAVYGVAQVVQALGLGATSASVSGFVTGLYVVLTPVLGVVLLRRRAGRQVWWAAGLSTAGLGVLSLHGLAVDRGVALTLVSALLYALHIVGLGQWSRPGTALGSTAVQLWVVTAVCALGAAPGGVQLAVRRDDWLVLVFMALVAGAGALLLQTWAQARLAADRAAVLMTFEPVWASLFAAVWGGERMGPRLLVGGALVLAAMYLAERTGPAPAAPLDPVPAPPVDDDYRRADACRYR